LIKNIYVSNNFSQIKDMKKPTPYLTPAPTTATLLTDPANPIVPNQGYKSITNSRYKPFFSQ
jgi:hypothetical protein